MCGGQSTPFTGLVDRTAKKTYGTGASWVDVPIDDIWLSPSPQEQVPPIVFTENVGSWLREHPIETHLFVFGTAKQLKEGSELQQALAAAAPRSDANLETPLIPLMHHWLHDYSNTCRLD